MIPSRYDDTADAGARGRCLAGVALALFIGLAGCGAADGSEIGPETPKLTVTVQGNHSVSPGSTVKLLATVKGTTYLINSYAWTVSHASQKVQYQPLSNSGDRISIRAAEEGTYTASCTVTLDGTTAGATGSASVQVDDPASKKLNYTVRITPPRSTGLALQDINIKVGSAQKSNLIWTVSEGQQLALKVTSAGAALPSVVRLFQVAGDPLPRDVSLPKGNAAVKVNGVFHALFLPAGEDVAPMLMPFQVPGKLAPSWDVALTKGEQVQGTVRTSDATPLVGADVALVATSAEGVDVPSTLGETDAAGSFSLLTRKGSVQMTITPPPGSALPVAVIKDQALTVSAGVSGWNFTYQLAKISQVAGTVTLNDGVTAAPGARVILLASDISAVGQLDHGGAGKLTARGLARIEMVADASGVLTAVGGAAQTFSIPQGKYAVEIWPGVKAPASQGVTRTTATLGTTETLKLKLSTRAKISGLVTDAGGAPMMATVTASGKTGTFATSSDTSGGFSLQVDDNDTYALLIKAASKTLSSHLHPALKISGDHDLKTVSLPGAVLLSGRVLTTSSSGVPGATIKVWCSGAGCPSSEIVDEIRTLVDGSFELRIPEAGGGS